MDSNEITVWNLPQYLAIYVIKFSMAFCFYLVTINTSYELGKSKYYRVDPMFAFSMNQ